MARHEAITKARWLAAQKRQMAYWQGKDVLEAERRRMGRDYAPMIQRYAETLPADARILDICSGPAFPAACIGKGSITYVDPLIDDFRRAYPGELPEGEFLTVAPEAIPKPSATFDLILCLNALDHVMNPELVLNEVERLLKPSGIFIMSLAIYPHWLARLRLLIEHCLPRFADVKHPYSYSSQGIGNTLARHFDIVEQMPVPAADLSRWFATAADRLFVCRPLKRS